jgi:hypothetical protein
VLLRHSRASASGAVVVKVNGEENRGEARTEEEERRSSFGGALLLKPHKAVDDGGAAPRLWAANNGSEAVGVCKVAAAAVQTRSAPPGRLCSDRETDGWAPRGFDFSNLSKTGSTLKIQNGCLILLQKFPIFACHSLMLL